MENQKEYGDKTITATKMLSDSGSYALQKVFENTHKGEILDKGYFDLIKRVDEEVLEFKEAMCNFLKDPTAKNVVKLCREGGDVIVFISAIMAKALGFKSMRRE